MARLQHLNASERDALVQLGARITEVRRSVPRRTIRAVADAAGIDASFLGELERGRINPSFVVLLRIANALAVPVQALVVPPGAGEDETALDADPSATGEVE
jgi:transcriptional regulator with XRE-family HTH domain